LKKQYDVSHVTLTEEILSKVIKIKVEMEKMYKEIGIKPESKRTIANDIWMRLLPLERYHIMQQVGSPKTTSVYLDRCIRAIAQYL
jgi:hypothetical protein